MIRALLPLREIGLRSLTPEWTQITVAGFVHEDVEASETLDCRLAFAWRALPPREASLDMPRFPPKYRAVLMGRAVERRRAGSHQLHAAVIGCQRH